MLTLACPNCESKNTFFLGIDNRELVRVETWRCNVCKKYFEKKYRIPPPSIPVETRMEIENREDKTRCAICKKIIPEERLKLRGKTCSRECKKIYDKQRKDEYHVERKRKLAEKKRLKG